MQYTILVATSVDDLVDQVNGRIDEGWRPSGGVSFTNFMGNVTVCQAMIRDGKS